MTDAFGGSSWVDLAGYLACLLVFLSFSMKSLLPLRVIAIASNVVFIIYSFAAQELPMLLLHGALLPLNIFRTAEQIKFFRQVRKSARGDIEVDALIPFMRPVSHSAGSYLFQKGDPASIIYYLSEGTVQIPEINKDLPQGTLFGEVGPFTAQRIRTASARCITDCKLQVISDTDIEKLCMKDPAFGLYLTKLIATRMAENQERSRGSISASGQDADLDDV